MGGYVAKGWCRNDRCLSPHELNGVYACGSNLKSPEANCCACGKPAAPSPPPPPPPPPSCLSEDAQCGGAGQRDRTCCAGLTCQGVFGGDGKYCKKTESCLSEHEQCGGAGQRDRTCCAGFTCQGVFGGDGKYCTKTESCLSEHAQCGGAGQRDRTCCAGLTCQGVFGGDGKYCTASSSQQYREYENKNAYHPYGATDIDDTNSAPSGLSPQ